MSDIHGVLLSIFLPDNKLIIFRANPNLSKPIRYDQWVSLGYSDFGVTFASPSVALIVLTTDGKNVVK